MHSDFCDDVPSIINVQFWFGAQDQCTSVENSYNFRITFDEVLGGYTGELGPLEVFCLAAPPNPENLSVIVGAVYESCQVDAHEYTDPESCKPFSVRAFFSISTPCCPEIIAPSGVYFYDGIPIPDSVPPPEDPLCYDCKGELVPCSELGGGCGDSCNPPNNQQGGGCTGRTCSNPMRVSENPGRYSSGEIIVRSRDLEVGGYGVPWGHTRTFQSRLTNNETIGNGFNWNVEEWPYLIVDYYGTVTVMGRASGSLWFDKVDGAYVPRFSTKHVLELDSEAGLYRLSAPDGTITEFDDFTGMFRKRIAPGGNSIEVTAMDTNAYNFTEVERTYTSGGDTITEQFLYNYDKSQADSLLSSITVRRKTNSGAWNNVSRATYTYYVWNEEYGGQEDLKTVTTQQWTGSDWEDTGTTYYRYHKSIQPDSSSSSSSGAGDGSLGDEHLIKYIIGPAAYARMIADGITDPLTASDLQISYYADNYFEYDELRRATKEVVKGGTETFLFEYETSEFEDDYNHWKTKTTETLPDGTQRIVYSNFAGTTMLKVTKSGTDEWVEFFEYDSSARVTLLATPAAVSGYNDTYADLLNKVDGKFQYLRDNAGLIRTYTRNAPTGWVASERVQQGQSEDSILTHEFEYIPCDCCNNSSSSSSSAGGQPVYFLSRETRYPSATDPQETIVTTYDYTWYEGTCQVQERVTTLPVIAASQNGSGIASTRSK